MTGALLESRSSEVEVLVNGVLLCSQLRDQVVLVPLWKSLEPDEARQWFKKNGPLPAVLHAPLICAGLLAAVRATQEFRRARRPGIVDMAALGVGIHAVVTLVVHVPTNIRLLVGERPASDVEVLVRRWARWHAVRTAALAFGEVAAIGSLIETRIQRR